ncbi:hypothetical protein [Streptomyces sp. NBC_00105]|uniref:hypothetical protein n=1 Tax=Streptomyces sp. NBC_00105 TaxID=2903622 RepID=UPI003252DA06
MVRSLDVTVCACPGTVEPVKVARATAVVARKRRGGVILMKQQLLIGAADPARCCLPDAV